MDFIIPVDAQIQWLPIKNLKPNPKNPNKHPEEQIERLAKIIRYQGWRSPIIVSNQSGYIVAGHGRLEAAKKLGFTTVPVQYQDFENEDQEYAHMTADNAIASWADLDLSGINLEVPNLGPDFDIEFLGLKDFQIEPADKYADKDADAVPETKESFVKRGDLWLLGNHRLLCGDATNKEDVDRLINNQKADMVYTDPPYGMNLDTNFGWYVKQSKRYKPVIGDGKDFSPVLIQAIFSIDCKEVFVWGADYFAELVPSRNQGSWICWDKRSSEHNIGLTDGAFGSDFEMCWSKSKHTRSICRVLRPVGHFAGKTNDDTVHPTQKPIALAEWFFERWGKDKTNIVDLYLGSGSTLIACEKTNRKCFGMEIDEHYCSVIVERWEKFTGKKATLEGGSDPREISTSA